VKGILFRLGVTIKDFGERLARVPILRFFAPGLKKLGLAIRDRALDAAPRECNAPKPCPVCGGSVAVIDILSYSGGKPWQVRVKCQDCGVVVRRFANEAETLGKAEG
jgi:hypothetical protein